MYRLGVERFDGCFVNKITGFYSFIIRLDSGFVDEKVFTSLRSGVGQAVKVFPAWVARMETGCKVLRCN